MNKKIFATSIILIASILIVSSSLIVVHNLENNNKNNSNVILKPVLLNTGYGRNEVVNSLEEIDYPKDDFELVKVSSSSSKSSSKKSKSSESSGNILISEKVSAGVGDEKIARSADGGGINVSKEAKIAENVSKTAQVEKDIIDYSVLSFEDLPPITVCDGEKIDKIALDLGKVKLSFGFLDFSCATALTMSGQANIWIRYCLMEEDIVGDDEIQCVDAYATTYDCETLDLMYLNKRVQERAFKNVDFSGFFGGVEGNTIEVYAKLLSPDEDFDTYVTTNYNIDLDRGCQCFSGECCSLSTHRFKSSGSQPTEYTDEYFCSGTNSATGTSYVKKKDYYCDGASSSAKSSDSTKDTCGICKYCDDSYSSCRNYDSSTSCGDKKHCDGKGNCVACQTHSNSKCYDNDVYWFDECGNVEDKKTECGSDGFTGSRYCYDNDVYQNYLIKGCLNSACYSESEKRRVEDCKYGCENGECKPNPIQCNTEKDCGNDKYITDNFCSEGDVYRTYRDYSCIKTSEKSYCSHSDTNEKIKDCGDSSYTGEIYCYDNDLYQDKMIKGCSDAQCTSSTGKGKIKDCGANGCLNGQCKDDTGKPDLIIKDAFIYYISDKTVFLRFIIENAGKGAAENVYWMIDTDSSDKNLSRTNPITLQAGDFTRAYMTWTYSEKKNYNPTIIVDPNNYVEESNENNNKQSVSATLVWYPT